MAVPDALPSLAAGAHDAGDGEACVMEYVSLLAGEEFSDRPECTHPLLAHEARTANDLLADTDRHRLVPLIGRLFGTTEDSAGLRTRLRLAQARQVMVLLEPDARGMPDFAVERAHELLGSTIGAGPDAAIEWARDLPRTTGDLDHAHSGFHLHASRLVAFVASPDLSAAEAWATVAIVAAHLAAAAGACRADCGDPFARGLRMVRDLGQLVDIYDDVTGRLAPDVSTDDLRALIRASA